MRNHAVDQCIWEHLTREDPLLQDVQKDKIIASRKKHIDESSMSDFVKLHLPCIEYEPDDENYDKIQCDGIAMKCLFTTETVRIVHVECVPDVLTYVRCAILKASFEDREDRREGRKRSFTGVHGVRRDKRRKTVYVVVKASDMPNGTKRIQAKPDDWTDTFIVQCARDLKDRVAQQGEIIAYLGGDDGPSPEKSDGCELEHARSAADGGDAGEVGGDDDEPSAEGPPAVLP